MSTRTTPARGVSGTFGSWSAASTPLLVTTVGYSIGPRGRKAWTGARGYQRIAAGSLVEVVDTKERGRRFRRPRSESGLLETASLAVVELRLAESRVSTRGCSRTQGNYP